MAEITHDYEGADSADVIAYYKKRFPQRVVKSLVEYETPFFAGCKKLDDLEGIHTVIPIELDSPQGMSALVGTAMGNMSTSIARAWTITSADNYGGIKLDGKTMLASRSDKGAFFKARERDYKNLMQQMGQRFEYQCWNDSSGSVGVLSADPGTGSTWTLTNPDDTLLLHENMTFRVYDDDGAGAPDDADERAGGPYVIAGIDEDAGTFTTTAVANAAIEVGDHIVRDGDVWDASTGAAVLATGIPKWIPAAAPTDTLFGVARTNYPQKLGGHRVAWQGSIEETAKKLDAKMRRVSQKGRVLWLSFANYNRLDLELGARGYRDENKSEGNFGRMRLRMTTPGGGVEVRCSPYCPEDAMFLLDPESWEVHTLGPAPHLAKDDGLSALRVGNGSSSEDAIEIRVRAFWQLVCVCPYSNGRAPIV